MLRKALLGLLLAAGALAVVEGGLRAVYSVDALLFEWERPTGLIATSLTGGVVTRPGMAEARTDGPYPWRVQLNEMGFREDRTIPRAEAGVYRVLALGDSWMFGFSVDQGKTVPDVLEGLLPAKLGVDRVEVVNAGVFGSSAFDMLARYRQLVETYDFDAVLLGTPHNSARFRELEDQRAAWYRQVRAGPASTLRLYLLVRWWMAPYRAGLYAEPPSGAGREPEFADIRALAVDAGARGMPVWFVEMPNNLPQAQAGFDGVPDWRAALEPAGVLFGGHALGERACWGFYDEGHPSEAGAYAIAARMAEVVASGRTLPVGAEPRCADGPAAGPTKPGWTWAR